MRKKNFYYIEGVKFTNVLKATFFALSLVSCQSIGNGQISPEKISFNKPYDIALSTKDKSDNYFAEFNFVAPTNGKYRIFLKTGGWIDIVQNGQTLQSINHGHVTDGSAHKFVDFELSQGPAIIVIKNKENIKSSFSVKFLDLAQ